MKKATFHTIAGLLALGLAFSANFAQAQAGTLDTTFGTGGIVTANLGVTATTLTAFEQSNGNIAVVTGFNKTRLSWHRNLCSAPIHIQREAAEQRRPLRSSPTAISMPGCGRSAVQR